jgi:iron complex transport system ATP-binding protein
LLLDEPNSSLDLAHQQSLFRIVRRFVRAGLGILVVLHDLNLAMRYADRVMVLRDGCNMACGTPEEVFQPPLIREVFNVEMQVFQAQGPVLVPVVQQEP